VSGVAALVRAYHPNLSAAQVRHRLEVTADHPPVALPDPQVGWGVVDPYAAVTAVLPEEQGSSDVRPLTLAPAVERAAAAAPSSTTPLVVAAICAVIAVLAAVAGGVFKRGRQRQWRTGTTASG
jgi:subtilisin family serine protease